MIEKDEMGKLEEVENPDNVADIVTQFWFHDCFEVIIKYIPRKKALELQTLNSRLYKQIVPNAVYSINVQYSFLTTMC